MTTNTDNPETEPKLTLTANEVFERHPLPWTHHLLLIKDANGRQVIHTGGLYGERGRLHEGAYLSGLNALLVEAANSRVSASPAGPVVDADVINNAANKIADYFNAPPSVIPAIEKIIQRCAAAASTASTIVSHHPLCGREIIPAEQVGSQLTELQVAYNQGVADSMCAIRAESQGGGYWAAAYINAIARRCSPFRYTGMPTDMDEPTREKVLQAITDIKEARESHVQWAAHLQDSTREDCQGCADHAAHIGNADYHENWIAMYDNVIAVLTRGPFASPSSQPAQAAAREIRENFKARFVIPSEAEIAAIISRYFPEP